MLSDRWLFQVCWNGAGGDSGDGGDGGASGNSGGAGGPGDASGGGGNSAGVGGPGDASGGGGNSAGPGGPSDASAAGGNSAGVGGPGDASGMGGNSAGVGGPAAGFGAPSGHGGIGSDFGAAAHAAAAANASTGGLGGMPGAVFGQSATDNNTADQAAHNVALDALFGQQGSVVSPAFNSGMLGIANTMGLNALAALAHAANTGVPGPSLGGLVAAHNAAEAGMNTGLDGLTGLAKGIGSDAVAGGTAGTTDAPDSGLGTQTGFGPTLGGNFAGPTSLSPSMGFPALEGVSPGITAMPGPSPTPPAPALSVGPGAIGSDAVTSGLAALQGAIPGLRGATSLTDPVTQMFGPPTQPNNINTTNLSPTQTPYAVIANPNIAPNQKASVVARTLARQSPAQQSQTISQAIATAQQTMTPPAQEAFLTSLLSFIEQTPTPAPGYTPTTGNVRGQGTYAP